ncbi:ATP-binding protein [Candidatus Woesearchaeota archaeon]|nr:ATP-binding protein [Candidatus Woesearchaeota archaeon]
MGFQERLEEMLEKTGHAEDGREIFRLRDTAYKWSTYPVKKCFDPVLEKLFRKGFEFSERREQEMRITCDEILLNSYVACEEREDLFVEYIVYFGTKGIVVHVKDEGEGFDHKQKLTDTREKPNQPTDDTLLYVIDVPGNTGLLCLLRFTNDFEYNKKGNEVIMRFDLPMTAC